MVSPTVIKRVRKLLALATSPNANEAASAADEAKRLMATHKIHPDDVADRTTEIVEERRDDFTKDLTRAVGKAAGLTVLWNKHGQIAFAGLPVDVAVAAEAYTELRNRARAGSTMPAFALPLPPEAADAWRAFYLTGFAAAVDRGVVAQDKVKPPPPQAPKEPEGPIDWGGERATEEAVEPPKSVNERSPVKEMLAFRDRYVDAATVKWLCDMAYAAGEVAGLNACRAVTFRRSRGTPPPPDDQTPPSAWRWLLK